MKTKQTGAIVAILMGLVAWAFFAGSAAAGDIVNWDNKITNANSRFKVLSDFNGEAVFDKETGLVWEKSPAITTHLWDSARSECTGRTVGGRKGWRLPSVHELASLVDPNSGLGLPLGHPFLNVQSDRYWSATVDALQPTTHAWNVIFGPGPTNINMMTVLPHLVWCVRGGMNADQY